MKRLKMPLIQHEHCVTPDEEGMRVDRIVGNLYPDVGRAMLQKMFRLGKIKIGDKKAIASRRVFVGDLIKIFSPPDRIKKEEPIFDRKMFERLKSMIIYEGEDFFALNKPAGLPVQLGTKLSFSVDTLIKSHRDCKCRIVHRLDKDVSGVLLIAKNQKSARRLTEMFRNNAVKKTYLAIVEGKITESGTADNFLEKSFAGNEEKIRVSAVGKRAVTFYRPLKLLGDYTLLELNPVTGRKHQLRVHCAETLKAPILGDRKYNKNPRC
ncbi:MAG: RluA family pseudouridine synthase, partial [Holosporaceae bacterium]|nr:RluA family pseudouridine synthase [Holosporaceae bacterium]